MPEGHSLERAARRLRPLVGARVDGGPLAGAVVSGVEARGKHLLVHTADGRSRTPPCSRCRTPIRSTTQGDHVRRTYHCPGCQAA